MKPKKIILSLTLTLFFTFQLFAQGTEILLNDGWKAKRAGEIPVDGTVISSPDFELTGWMNAVVPGTVLTTLLNNEIFPDTFFGLNNELILPVFFKDNYITLFPGEQKKPEINISHLPAEIKPENLVLRVEAWNSEGTEATLQ